MKFTPAPSQWFKLASDAMPLHSAREVTQSHSTKRSLAGIEVENQTHLYNINQINSRASKDICPAAFQAESALLVWLIRAALKVIEVSF